jgi:DNA-binding beta-propeller fold protein YncE
MPEPQPPMPEPQLPEPPRLRLSATAVDFGPIAHRSRSPERRIRLSNAGGGTLNAHAATQAGWLELRQEGDDLVLAVDTTVAGRLEHTVTVDSDGGSATINVQAVVEPVPQPAATHTEATRNWARPHVPAPSTPAHRPGTRPASRPARRRAWIAIATACVIAVAGVAYFLLGRAPVSSPEVPPDGGHGGTAPPPILALPGCTTATAPLKPLPDVRTEFVQVGGRPFDVVVTPNHSGFVSLRKNQPLTIVNTASFAPTPIGGILMADAEGEAFTYDGHHLLVAGGSGMTVFQVKDLEAGLSSPVGSLASPGGKRALQVVPSPDDRFAFVALQDSGTVAVFNLHKALTQGFGPADFVGNIPISLAPTGIAASPDGRYLYVVSGQANTAVRSGMGKLTIVDMHKAVADPGSSIVKTVNAGYGPARVITSPDGNTVWVTAGGGNTLEAFSAGKLLTDTKHALIAKVPVGQIPLGLVLVSNGTRMVVADSNRDNVAGSSSDLAVIDVDKALARRPGALLGTIKSEETPRQFALEPDGKTLLVTNTDSGQLEAVDVSQLP